MQKFWLNMLIFFVPSAVFAATTDDSKIVGVIEWIGGAGKWAGVVIILFGALQLAMAMANQDQMHDKIKALKILLGGAVVYNAGFLIWAIYQIHTLF
ncbi:MAG: hypothetical protein LBL34_03515 [Clostridiales bacterium]|jgi:hypothetical protein|nr:hypothetical protein [Clostridiales bacterium]